MSRQSTGRAARQTVTLSRRHYDAVIFDLDGVVTATAEVHARAWRRMFDAFLEAHPQRPGANHAPFSDDDYRQYIDGRSRPDGVSAFLAARNIYLPYGDPTDPPERPTVWGLGNRKDRYFQEELRTGGVRVYQSTVDVVRELRRHGFGTAVVSSSRNCGAVLAAAGLADLFDVQVDGLVAARLRLPGKPDPALFHEATQRLHVAPARTVVVEDSEVGVAAGRRGGFALVIGVDRTGHEADLRTYGADRVVRDLAEVSVDPDPPPTRPETTEAPPRPLSALPSGAEGRRLALARVTGRELALFCDFDGTMAPIAEHPDGAYLPRGARQTLERLASRYRVAVISGRDLVDVRARVGLPGLWYAGCHGLDIAEPDGTHRVVTAAARTRPALRAATDTLRRQLADVAGCYVETKRFGVAVHYRCVAPDEVDRIGQVVRQVADAHPELVATSGRKVFELRPAVAWDKGVALRWLLRHLRLVDREGAVRRDVVAVYAGDDLTDEDALRVVRHDGLGIVVRSAEHGDRSTAAHVAVADPAELWSLLDALTSRS